MSSGVLLKENVGAFLIHLSTFFFFLQLAHDPTYPTAGNTVTALALSVPRSLVVM